MQKVAILLFCSLVWFHLWKISPLQKFPPPLYLIIFCFTLMSEEVSFEVQLIADIFYKKKKKYSCIVCCYAFKPSNVHFLIVCFIFPFLNVPSHTCMSSVQDANIDIKLPRRSLLVQFTCDVCGERTERLINRLAYERGLIYIQVLSWFPFHCHIMKVMWDASWWWMVVYSLQLFFQECFIILLLAILITCNMKVGSRF